MFLYLFGVAADGAAQEVVAQVVDFHLEGGLVARGFDATDVIHVGYRLVVGEHLQGADNLEGYTCAQEVVDGEVIDRAGILE